MAQKFYVDIVGNYLGSWDGSEPPIGSIEVFNAPDHASQKWDKKTKTWGEAIIEETPEDKLFSALKLAAPQVFTDEKIAEIKGE